MTRPRKLGLAEFRFGAHCQSPTRTGAAPSGGISKQPTNWYLRGLEDTTIIPDAHLTVRLDLCCSRVVNAPPKCRGVLLAVSNK